jgi:hypothetical protein
MVPEAGHQRFRLKVRMMAVSEERIIVDIPAGEEVASLDSMDGPHEFTRQVKIKWRGEILGVFAVDLRDRAIRLEAE